MYIHVVLINKKEEIHDEKLKIYNKSINNNRSNKYLYFERLWKHKNKTIKHMCLNLH